MCLVHHVGNELVNSKGRTASRDRNLNLRRDVLGSQLCFHVSVVQLADEGVGPSLAGVHGDVVVILAVPFPPLSITAKRTKPLKNQIVVL